MTLDDLGPRICIMGPSNSGKSTLATAIGRARGLTPIHLDLLYHIPNTDWQPRTDEEFIALHDEALSGASWVIDGNYSGCLPQTLARATGLILLDTSTATSLLRYRRRSRLERDRPDGLEGAWIASSGDDLAHRSHLSTAPQALQGDVCPHQSAQDQALNGARIHPVLSVRRAWAMMTRPGPLNYRLSPAPTTRPLPTQIGRGLVGQADLEPHVYKRRAGSRWARCCRSGSRSRKRARHRSPPEWRPKTGACPYSASALHLSSSVPRSPRRSPPRSRS